MIRANIDGLGLIPCSISRYNGNATPALFSCVLSNIDGGSTYCVLYRCDLVDDARGAEINNRIAEIERLAEDAGHAFGA